MDDGIFDLKSVYDLFKKLEFDYERLKQEPNNTYIAFDLFMTAAHIPDWIKNGDTGRAREFRRDKPILRLCYQLACGGKHFHLKSKEHNSVESAEKSKYVEDGYIEQGYFEEPLEVALTGNLARKLGVSNPASALKIATLAVNYWQSWINSQS